MKPKRIDASLRRMAEDAVLDARVQLGGGVSPGRVRQFAAELLFDRYGQTSVLDVYLDDAIAVLDYLKKTTKTENRTSNR